MTSCTKNSECVLVKETCCPCGVPLRSTTAINVGSWNKYRQRLCGWQRPHPCPGCRAAPNAHLIATCEEGKCTVVDLHAEGLTECQVDDDCRLRTKDCCECGASTSVHNYAAVRSSGEKEFAAYRCDPDTVCRQCAPARSSEGAARCKCNRCVFYW